MTETKTQKRITRVDTTRNVIYGGTEVEKKLKDIDNFIRVLRNTFILESDGKMYEEVRKHFERMIRKHSKIE